MDTFSLGGASRERVEVRISDAARAKDVERWLRAHVVVAAGGFSGSFDMSILAEELGGFRDELIHLHRTLTGDARFRTLEGQLSLDLIANGRGEVRVLGEARDNSATRNTLTFELAIDQTHLGSTIEQLNAVIESVEERAG